ncbi:MAG: hypothetical protein SOX84_04780 [Prevotella sp.]|nr:hypothetical protein [Prevotella sp.]MDY4218076.1 hypothetical protein [Prevotella sp.]
MKNEELQKPLIPLNDAKLQTFFLSTKKTDVFPLSVAQKIGVLQVSLS